MPPKKQKPPHCQICETNDSKYTCARCYVVYCSVACFKEHKANSCNANANLSSSQGGSGSLENTQAAPPPSAEAQPDETPPPAPPAPETDSHPLTDPPTLRPLTSLKWPYVPEESAYPDPLKRDDPKVLQLHQYEAIATSPTIRHILSTHPRLPALLTRIDALRGPQREDALQKALGVTPQDVADLEPREELDEDTKALRELAEAIEAAVRGGNERALGLDWGSDE